MVVRYEGLVVISSGKVYSIVGDDLVVLGGIDRPWEDFGYSFAGAGLDRIGVKAPSTGSSGCTRGDE